MKDACVRCGKVTPWVCFFGNATLAGFKVAVGTMTGSKGLVYDGLHSASDVAATIMVLISLRIAARDEDAFHPWGYGKIEFAGALLVYTMLFTLSLFLLEDSLRTILAGTAKPPHLAAFLAASVSIVTNSVLSGYGFCAGKQLNSPAMIANANENKADMLSSVAVVIGIVVANMGYPSMDAVAALVVALIIFKTSVGLGLDALRHLLDASLSPQKLELLRTCALGYQDVKGISFVRARRVGQSVSVDMEILVDRRKTVREGYAIAREVRLALIRKFEQISEANVSFTSA